MGHPGQQGSWRVATHALLALGSAFLVLGMALAFRKLSPLDALRDPALRLVGAPFPSFRRTPTGMMPVETTRYESPLEARTLMRRLGDPLRRAGFRLMESRRGPRERWRTADGRYEVLILSTRSPYRPSVRSRVWASAPSTACLDVEEWLP